MSTRSPMQSPTPAAAALAEKVSLRIGTAVADERQRRGWTVRHLAARARVTPSTVTNVEAGRRASLDVCARLAVALGLSLDLTLASRRGRTRRAPSDVVHAAMGEFEAGALSRYDYRVAIDHPYQHYQFAGRADVLAWSASRRTMLHIENRTRFPNLQDAAGSFNAKCQYLAPVLARQMELAPFRSQVHVIVALWSSEVIHAIRLRPRSFQALCPDPADPFLAWLAGEPPSEGVVRTLVLLDPFARGRQRAWIGLEAATGRAKARTRGYAEAAARLERPGAMAR